MASLFDKEKWFDTRQNANEIERRVYEANHHNQICSYLYNYSPESRIGRLAYLMDNKLFSEIEAMLK